MVDKLEPKAIVLLVEEGCITETATVRPLLSSYFEFFRSKRLMGNEIPEEVEFRPDSEMFTVWLAGVFVAFTDVMPFNDVYQSAGTLDKFSPIKWRVANRTAQLATVLDHLVKSCTDDKGVPVTPSQEAVDQAKAQLIQYQTNNLSGD